MVNKNVLISGVFVLIAVLLAIGFSQSGKSTNVKATLSPPDFETASALIAKGRLCCLLYDSCYRGCGR